MNTLTFFSGPPGVIYVKVNGLGCNIITPTQLIRALANRGRP